MNTQQGPIHSTKSHFQHPMINCVEKNMKKYMCVCTESLYYTQKLTQHWKSITLP